MYKRQIEHDPYVLISILSAFNEGEFTLDEVQGLLQTLFDQQYILTEDVEVEVRYRRSGVIKGVVSMGCSCNKLDRKSVV